MLKAKLKIKDSVKVAKDLQDVAVSGFNSILLKSYDSIKSEVQEYTKFLLNKSAFVDSLINGDLRGHFGLTNEEAPFKVFSIIDTIIEDIEVTYKPLKSLGGRIDGGFTIGIGSNGFEKILNSLDGTVTTEAGETLEWLNWVLTQGDKIIISNHNIRFDVGFGRSNLAIMIPSNVSSWRVPSEFSGTVNDNWITREIKSNIETYNKIINKIITNNVRRVFDA